MFGLLGFLDEEGVEGEERDASISAQLAGGLRVVARDVLGSTCRRVDCGVEACEA
jgi:hypothetical protein